jgi:cardiolipin synthase
MLLQYRAAKYVFVLFLIKESYMGIMGLKVIRSTGKNDGAMWYGKVSTAFFYVVMVLLALVPEIPTDLGECLLISCGALMLLSLILYARRYSQLQRDVRESKILCEGRETAL